MSYSCTTFRAWLPLFLFVCVCLSLCVHANMCEAAFGVKKGVSNPMELELQVVMSFLAWALGTELGPLLLSCLSRLQLSLSLFTLFFPRNFFISFHSVPWNCQGFPTSGPLYTLCPVFYSTRFFRWLRLHLSWHLRPYPKLVSFPTAPFWCFHLLN